LHGTASFSTAELSAKTHAIKAQYAGDAGFKESTGTVHQVVEKFLANVALTTSPNPSTVRQAVALSAAVTSSGPHVPTGKIIFKNGSTTLGAASLDPTGTATFSTTKLPTGTNSITAAYTGDAENDKSTSSPVAQTVN
jgi:hypothetical protein